MRISDWSSDVCSSDLVKASRNALDYLTRIWVPNLRLRDAETITVGGMPAATDSARVQLKSGGNADLRFVAVGFPTDDILRFVVIAPAGRLAKIAPDMIRSVDQLQYLPEDREGLVEGKGV